MKFSNNFEQAGGNLYRKGCAEPIRPGVVQHNARIETLAQLKAALRAGPYTWPGGYPVYFIASNGDPLSYESVLCQFGSIVETFLAKHKSSDWRISWMTVNYEDDDLRCAHSGELIECAYGE